jgi:hypothetical protein
MGGLVGVVGSPAEVPVPMIYLVRWQDLSAALVSATDERELVRRLDELAALEGVTWSVYQGPLWFELEVPVALTFPVRRVRKGAPLRLDDIRLVDTGELRAGALDASAASSGTGKAMVEEVYRRAFPRLHRVLYGDRAPGGAALRKALREELRRLVEAHRRLADRDRSKRPAGRVAAPGRRAARMSGRAPTARAPERRRAP